MWTIWQRAGNEYYIDNMDEAALRHSMRTGTDREAFAAALDEKGIMFARASKEEAATSHREASLARAAGNYAPRFKQDEIVIGTEPRLEYRREGAPIEPRRVYKLDQSLAQKFVESLGTEGKLQSIGATLKASDERAQQRAAEKDELRLERATDIYDRAPTRGKEGILAPAAELSDTAARALGDVLNAGVSTAGFLFSIFDPRKSPSQLRTEAIKAEVEREVQAEAQIDFSNYKAERAQEQRNEQERQAARDRERENERQR